MGFLKKAWKTVKKAVRTVVWVMNRIGSIFELALSLLRFRPEKKMRIHGWILAEHLHGKFVPVEDEDVVKEWFVKAGEIIKREATVKLLNDGGGPRWAWGAREGAPASAITPPSDTSFLNGGAEEFYDDYHPNYSLFGIRVFIVKDFVPSVRGSSWPVFTGIAAVRKTQVTSGISVGGGPDVLVHEIGHLCGLFHRNGTKSNLMCSSEAGRTGTNLTQWQVSVLRTSEYTSWL